MTEVWDDYSRVVRTRDADGVEVSTRPYTEEENAALDAKYAAQEAESAAQKVALAEQEVVHAETHQRVKAIINDLQAEKARVQPTIDASNATINANPAGYIKDNARAIKRIADATIDLAKFVDGR